MGFQPYCPPQEPPPVGNGGDPEPPPVDCGCEPGSSPSEPSDSAGLGGLLRVLPNVDITGDAGAMAPQTGLSAVMPVDISLNTNPDSQGGLNIDLSPVEASTPDVLGDSLLDIGGLLGGGGSEGTHPLVSLDSGEDAVINVPLFGENGALGNTTDIGGIVGGGGTGGDGLPLVSLDSGEDAVINVPLFGEDGVVNGSHDVGSLLSAAMLDIGGGGLGAVLGGDVYDGNVPLASDLSSALGSTLDLLTTTSSLFDVPALDILGCDGLDS